MKNFLFVFLLLLSGLSVAAQDKIIEVTLTSGSTLAIQANEWRMVTEKPYGVDIDYGYGTTAVVHRATNTYDALASSMCSSGIVTQIYIQGILTNVVINVRYVAKIVQKPNGKGSIVMLQSNKVWDTNITYAEVVDLFDNCITSGGGGGGATNLSFTRTATTLTVTSDTGSDAVLPAATTSLSGVLSATDKTKLDGLSNYTAPNHTGDITSVGDGATTIVANSVDNTKLSDMPATTLKGNNTGSTGNPTDLTVAQTKTLLAYTGAEVSNTPAGTIAATNTQTALNELDSEKHVSVQLKDEGSNLGTSGTTNSIDFAGVGVTATRSGSNVTVTIPGGGGGGLTDGDYGDIDVKSGGTVMKIDTLGATNGQVLTWNGSSWVPGMVSGGGSNAPDSTFQNSTGTPYWGKTSNNNVFRAGKTSFGKNLNLGQTSFYGHGNGLNNPVISLSVDTTQNYHLWAKFEQTRQSPYAYTPFGIVSSYDGIQPGGYKDYVWSLGPNAAGNSGSSFDYTKPMSSINWETSWNDGGVPTYEWHEHWKQPDSSVIRLSSYTIRYANATNPTVKTDIDYYTTADNFGVSRAGIRYFSTSRNKLTGTANVELQWSKASRLLIGASSTTCAITTTGQPANQNYINFGANDGGVIFGGGGGDFYSQSARTMNAQNFSATGVSTCGSATILSGNIDMVSGQRLLRTNPSQSSIYFGNSAGPNTALTVAGFDIGIGFATLGQVVNGTSKNVAVGSWAGQFQAQPKNNVFLGTYVAGNTNTNMQKCVLIGDSCSINTSGNNRLWIENSGSTTPLISGNFATDKVGINVPNGTLRTTMDIRGTDAITIPSGTTAQRITGAVGDVRVNTTTGNFEGVRVGTTYENFQMGMTVQGTLDYPSITPLTTVTLTITVTGATTQDFAVVQPVSGVASNTVITAWVSGPDTVTVSVANLNGIAIDPPSQTFNVKVIKN